MHTMYNKESNKKKKEAIKTTQHKTVIVNTQTYFPSPSFATIKMLEHQVSSTGKGLKGILGLTIQFLLFQKHYTSNLGEIGN